MSEFIHPPELSLFAEPWPSQGINKIQLIEYRPVTQLNDNSVVEFQVPSSGMQYLDLGNTKLHMKLQIVKEDGSPLDGEDDVAFIATPVHSMWSQIDISLQQQSVTPAHNLHAYRAYLDKLLYTCTSSAYPQSESELYILDGNDNLDEPNSLDEAVGAETPKNAGLAKRAKFTSSSRIIDVESSLHCDICQQDRYILNSVDMRVRLYPSQDAFRLMAKAPHKYHVKIIDIFLNVCKVTVSAEVLLAHNEILQTKPALYPFFRTDMKTYTVPKGQYTHIIDEPFRSIIPSKLYVFLVRSDAFNGDLTKNPFNFQHFNIRSIAFYSDGLSVPNQPQKMNFGTRDFISAYNALLDTAGRSDTNTEFDINTKRYGDGFTVFGFNLESMTSHSMDYWSKPSTAHTRLELQFRTPLEEAVNVILMGTYPSCLKIDSARNVTTSAQ